MEVEPDVFLYTAAISQCARAGDVATQPLKVWGVRFGVFRVGCRYPLEALSVYVGMYRDVWVFLQGYIGYGV